MARRSEVKRIMKLSKTGAETWLHRLTVLVMAFLACTEHIGLIAAILSVPSICLANPIMFNPMPFVVVPALLVAEGIIITVLARRSEPYRLRFVGTWFLVTLITFFGLLAGVESVTRGENSAIVITLKLFLGECFVTVIEAAAIWLLLRWKFTVRNVSGAPSPRTALIYSAIVNAVSFAGGWLSAYVPQLIFN